VNQVAAVVAMTIIVEKVVAEISLVAMAIGLCMCCCVCAVSVFASRTSDVWRYN
jgi:hypothetical protein